MTSGGFRTVQTMAILNEAGAMWLSPMQRGSKPNPDEYLRLSFGFRTLDSLTTNV